MMKIMLRGIIIAIGLIAIWQLLIIIFKLQPYILPSPQLVFSTWYFNINIIGIESITTCSETLLGLALGILMGTITAITMAFYRPLSLWMLPIVIISQALPTFAIAPLLVIWFGYGMASKIATTVLIIFFPVTSALYDGLRRTNPHWLELAKSMDARKWRTFWYIRFPAALPHYASGIRLATVAAPIGAIVGEWVGASHGLGYLMLNANARMQIDLMFAALMTIVIFSLVLYFIVDKILRYFIFWERIH